MTRLGCLFNTGFSKDPVEPNMITLWHTEGYIVARLVLVSWILPIDLGSVSS